MRPLEAQLSGALIRLVFTISRPFHSQKPKLEGKLKCKIKKVLRKGDRELISPNHRN